MILSYHMGLEVFCESVYINGKWKCKFRLLEDNFSLQRRLDKMITDYLNTVHVISFWGEKWTGIMGFVYIETQWPFPVPSQNCWPRDPVPSLLFSACWSMHTHMQTQSVWVGDNGSPLWVKCSLFDTSLTGVTNCMLWYTMHWTAEMVLGLWINSFGWEGLRVGSVCHIEYVLNYTQIGTLRRQYFYQPTGSGNWVCYVQQRQNWV